MAYASQQIFELRKRGDLQGAYRLAVDAHRNDPTNKYISGELAWVLYYCLKRYADADSRFFENGAAYAQCLRVIYGYNLDPRENDMFYENLVKSVGITSRDLANKKKVEDLRKVFEATVSLSAIDARFRNTYLMNAFLRGFTDSSRYLVDAIKWYGFDSLTPEDYQGREYQGKKIPGLAESMANNYLDCLVKRDHNDHPLFALSEQEEAVASIKQLLAKKECARWKWTEYKLGKLLLAMGKNAEARDIFAPFVLRKPKEAYAWVRYGETFSPNQPDLYDSCIFRALQLSKDLQYALSYHERAIEAFSSMGDYGAAKLEAETVAKYRNDNGWSQSKAVIKAQHEPWYASVEKSEDNSAKYRDLGAKAEATLEAYVPKIDFYLEWTDPKKGLAGIDTFPTRDCDLSKVERLCLHDSNLARNYERGKVYTASIDKKGLRMYGSAVLSDNKRMETIFARSFTGIFEAVNSYGFVHTNDDDVWIPERLVKKHGLVTFARVSGKTLASFRKRKGEEKGRWTLDPVITDLTLPAPGEGRIEFKSEVRITPRGFGFTADDYFISDRLIESCDLRDGDIIMGVAVKSWNKKKRQWGWAVSKITERIDVTDDSPSTAR